jgi:hypothetical protein
MACARTQQNRRNDAAYIGAGIVPGHDADCTSRAFNALISPPAVTMTTTVTGSC